MFVFTDVRDFFCNWVKSFHSRNLIDRLRVLLGRNWALFYKKMFNVLINFIFLLVNINKCDRGCEMLPFSERNIPVAL